MQRQECELRIRVIAAARRIRPGALIRPFADLLLFQPAGVAADQQQVFFRFGRTEDHRLQRRAVGRSRLLRRRPQVRQCLLNDGRIRLNSGIQQRERAQGSDIMRAVCGPSAVPQLFPLKVIDRLLNTVPDRLRIDVSAPGGERAS
jgi:hypothetical protein